MMWVSSMSRVLCRNLPKLFKSELVLVRASFGLTVGRNLSVTESFNYNATSVATGNIALDHSQSYQRMAAQNALGNRDDRREFLAVFPDIVRNLTEVGFHKDLDDANKWYAKVLQYNGPGGKMTRGLTVPLTYRLLTEPNEVSDEDYKLANILGWCVELLQSFFLVSDDIMDESPTRRGKAAWYTKDDVGMMAINDAILMEAGIYKLLRLYFGDKPYYVDLVDILHNTTMKTSLGQCLDMLSTPTGKRPDLSKFTMDRYSAIVKYKTAHYSFHLPVALAFYMAGVKDPEMHRQAKTILLQMGHVFQAQDDFLDCYGDPAVIGKVGTDIEDGKCSWLVVTALQRASASQKQILEENYAFKDPAKVAKVKQLYTDLDIPKTFMAYEEKMHGMIQTTIQQTSRGLPHKVFYMLMEKIYKRKS